MKRQDPLIIEADFNNVSQRRINLSRMKRHQGTPFAEIAAAGDRILFIDYEEAVFGYLERDAGGGDWFAVPDWDTQHEIEPARRPTNEIPATAPGQPVSRPPRSRG